MSFEPTLQKMIDGCSGAIGVALMGTDGIAVAESRAQNPDLSVLDGEVSAAGIEFGRILDDVRKAADALNGGRLEEVVVGLARFTLLFRSVDDELFLVVALAEGGNLGKARFLMRRHLLELREQL